MLHAVSIGPSLLLGLFFAAQDGLNLGGMRQLADQARSQDGRRNAMKCPYCAHLGDKVVDSRESKEGEVIRRRRECLDCGKRFTSYERIDEIPYMVVKKDGTRERFERQKLIAGLLKACEKRPVSVAALEAVADRVEATLQERPEKEIATAEIGAFVMEELKKLDKVAYVRFASVYRHFRDIGEFMSELKRSAEREGVSGGSADAEAADGTCPHRHVDHAATVAAIGRRAAPAAPRRPFRDNPRLILAGIVVLLAALVGIARARQPHAAASRPTSSPSSSSTRCRPPTSRCWSALVFVLARNIIKLVVERRRALPFARFRAKLVALLLG